MESTTTLQTQQNNNALDAEPPIASLLKSMLIGGGPVNADVIRRRTEDQCSDSALAVIAEAASSIAIQIEGFTPTFRQRLHAHATVENKRRFQLLKHSMMSKET